MKNKLTTLFAIILIFVGIFTPVTIKADYHKYFDDKVGLYSDAIVEEYYEKINTLKEEMNTEVYFLTVESLNGLEPIYYLDDFYENNTAKRDAILVLIQENDKTIFFKGYGRLANYFNENYADWLKAPMQYYVVKKDYASIVHETFHLSQSCASKVRKDLLAFVSDTYFNWFLPSLAICILLIICVKRNKKAFLKLFKKIKKSIKYHIRKTKGVLNAKTNN